MDRWPLQDETFASFFDANDRWSDLLDDMQDLKRGDAPKNFDGIPGVEYQLSVSDGEVLDCYYRISRLTRWMSEEGFRALRRDCLEM